VRYPTAMLGRLEGQVILNDTARAPVRIHVAIGSRPAIETSPTGAFVFDSLPSGQYPLRVRRIGYRGWTGTVRIPADSGLRLVTMLAFDSVALCSVRLAP
jgi:hypothetical protein